MRDRNREWAAAARVFAVALAMVFAGACRDSDSDTAGFAGVHGTVTDGTGAAVAGAKVYLVPATSVNQTPITAADVRDGDAEAYDEPLEDAVAASGTTFKQATTTAAGKYEITGLTGSAKYYVYVEPAATDTAHLPGGDVCRVARTLKAGGDYSFDVKLSGKPANTALTDYKGNTACVACHTDYAGQKYHGHANGISVAGAVGGLQSHKLYPDHDEALAKFKSAAAYTSGTMLTLGDYDSTRSFDKFKVVEDTVAAAAAGQSITTTYVKYYLWKDTADSKYKITITNELNAGDPNTPLTLEVPLTYGGTLYKQRMLVKVPAGLSAGREGHYPLLQYQSYAGISDGSDSNPDRTRLVWRDYHMDWWWGSGTDATYGTADDVLKAPSASKTFEEQCAGCHFNAYELKAANTAGEKLADAVNDASGAYDIDGDGNADQINIGCETCHGPGKDHVDASTTTLNGGKIVALGSLSPERANQVCGFCHDRQKGVNNTDNPVDASGRMPLPGISRPDYLATYVAAKKGPAAGDNQTDDVHAKSHHQHLPDMLKSRHYRNERQLVVCSDCHDAHAYRTQVGLTEYRHFLADDPDTADSTLCLRCHAITPADHMQDKTGASHAGVATSCSRCHMVKTAKTGAGSRGLILNGPPVSSSDLYWAGDISSHVFDVIRKTDLGVAGTTPGSAMAAPYTNACGTCHDVSRLRYQTATTVATPAGK